MSGVAGWLGPAVVIVVGIIGSIIGWRSGTSWYAKIFAFPGKWFYINVILPFEKALDNKIKGQVLTESATDHGPDARGEFESGFWEKDFKVTKKQFQAYAGACSLLPP